MACCSALARSWLAMHSYHLSHFRNGDVVLAFESAIWVTINDTSVCQLETAWYAQESGVTSENGLAANAVVTQNCCCCKDCCELFFHS